MSFPVILIDSGSGSDTQASGAGPSTALFGTTDASTDGAGTTVTLTAGTDLSGVATDGSHVIFLNDTTAGARNFGKITGSAGSGGATPTVSVSNAFGLSLSGKSWAIGGKRATIAGTTSLKLFTNNLAAGDAMPGWIVEMQSGHTETLAATYVFRRTGDITDGRITLQGTLGAATPPIITFSNNGNGFSVTTNIIAITLRDFEIRNSNATKTASVAIVTSASSANLLIVERIKIAASGASQFWKAISSVSGNVNIENCDIGNCASNAISTSVGPLTVRNCFIHDNGGNGVSLTGSTGGTNIEDCIFANNAQDDINDGRTATTLALTPIKIRNNIFYNSAGDGYECTVTNAQTDLAGAVVENNIFSEITGSGINLSGTGGTDIQCAAHGARIRNNCFFNCGAKYSGMTIASSVNESTADPQFTNAAGNDFRIGTNLKALGYPSGNIGGGSSTPVYVDIGPQRQEASSGGVTASTVSLGCEGVQAP